MSSLLDNRKNLTPRESVEAINKYARQQDSAILSAKVRKIRGGVLVNGILFGSLTFYLINQYIYGYWMSYYPRSIISVQVEGAASKRRPYFAPEIYLKDMERWQKDLKTRDIATLKK